MNEAQRLRKENKRLEKTLPQDIQEEYSLMIQYLRSYEIEPIENELIRRNIFNLVSDGIKEGKNFKDIIGGDWKVFIDEVAKKTPKNTLPKRFIGVFIFTQLIYIFIRNWFLNYTANLDTFENITLNAGDAITAIVLAVGCFYLLDNIYSSILNNQMTKSILMLTLILTVIVAIQVFGFMIQLPSIEVPTFGFYVVTILIGCFAVFQYKGHKN